MWSYFASPSGKGCLNDNQAIFSRIFFECLSSSKLIIVKLFVSRNVGKQSAEVAVWGVSNAPWIKWSEPRTGTWGQSPVCRDSGCQYAVYVGCLHHFVFQPLVRTWPRVRTDPPKPDHAAVHSLYRATRPGGFKSHPWHRGTSMPCKKNSIDWWNCWGLCLQQVKRRLVLEGTPSPSSDAGFKAPKNKKARNTPSTSTSSTPSPKRRFLRFFRQTLNQVRHFQDKAIFSMCACSPSWENKIRHISRLAHKEVFESSTKFARWCDRLEQGLGTS